LEWNAANLLRGVLAVPGTMIRVRAGRCFGEEWRALQLLVMTERHRPDSNRGMKVLQAQSFAIISTV
jgi:hypothetical protein